MDRRHFLRAGAVSSGGLVVVSGCGASGLEGALLKGVASAPPTMSDADVQSFLKRLNGQMVGVQERKPMAGLLELCRGKTNSEDLARGDALVRKTLRSLLLAGSFSDLPVEARAHPNVQQRMFDGMNELDEATLGMRDVLANVTPTERADMARALREDPELAMSIVGAIDEEAGRIGVTGERRLHLRTLAAHVSSRMKQSPGLFMDELVNKVDKMKSRDLGAASMERRIIAQMGEDEFFSVRDRMVAANRTWRVAGSHKIGTDGEAEEELDEDGQRRRLGTPLLTVGGVLMGMCLVYTTIGLLLVLAAGSFAGAFVLTHAALVLIGGLVTLILGGIRRARS